ncbi:MULTISPECIES: amino acid ABC transporter substrate-binding protein [unclassified Microbacterium]|uniref:amino acid ABC transporter substrate-binding protein n=1 Tax=unclassified Microbacterium TaxID=2609290 RepID=UPI0036560A2B
MFPRPALRRIARVAALGAALAATALLAACSGTAAPTASATGPLVIGTSLPMTGPVADVSKSGYQGYELWAEQTNAAGGLLGRQVKLKVLDNGFNPEQVTTDYTRLIAQDHAELLLGTFSSLLNAPASAVAERQRMLYVQPSGGAQSLFDRGFRYFFFAQPGTSANLPDNFVAYIESLPASQRPKTAAYVTQDDPSAAPAIAAFQKKFEALGISTMYSQTYDPGTTAFDSIAASVAHAQPEMIVQGAVADDGAQFVRSLQKLDYNPRFLFQTNAPTDEKYPEAIGSANTQAIFTGASWNAQAEYPGNAEFVAAYTKKYGAAPTEDAANSYTAGQVLAAAVKAVGSLDQTALADWLHAHSVDTIVGPLKWDTKGDPEGSLLLSQWQDGTLQIVAPADAATSKTIAYPKPAWSTK